MVGMKDVMKLVGIMIISFCAVFVCHLFLNYYMDLIVLKDDILMGGMMIFYEAQLSTAKLISFISGGCLILTSVIMLFFYIKHYIDIHRKELGILKALGYSRLKIASHFWRFGFSVLIGCLLGYGGSFWLMPTFYATQNQDKILPDMTIHFHFLLFIFLVVLPTVLFSLLAIVYSYYKLRGSSLTLLKEAPITKAQSKKYNNNKDIPFLTELRQSTVKSKKTLAFFVIFAAFCFSSMTQMAMKMDELASEMMGVMMMVIGIILASTTLFLAITTVINGHLKTISMMRLTGYSQKECAKALLGGYRPMAYLGFILGTIYQYGLIQMMLLVVFKDVAGIPQYHFDFVAMFISLFSFIVIYEIVMYVYSQKIKSLSIKAIMLE
ncbi:FtsX-like permease family protein [Longibaculum muris]|uniref:FtsX-like permease family protein n=1 Tax=Longibaculum muris TaxID=1796628 RepID=UPI0022DEB41A|nr:ABC transporter permease [Longibaculum muris]